jgi:hypothetical protein
MANNPLSITLNEKETDCSTNGHEHVHCPPVIKDLFVGLSIDLERNRWCAKCKICSVLVTDVYKTTSNYFKHMKKKHATMFHEWRNKHDRVAGKSNQPAISDIFKKKEEKCK